MVGADRLRQTTDALRQVAECSVADLAAIAGASEMAARRDLEVLAEQGILERYRGGARGLLLRSQDAPLPCLRAQEGREVERALSRIDEPFHAAREPSTSSVHMTAEQPGDRTTGESIPVPHGAHHIDDLLGIALRSDHCA